MKRIALVVAVFAVAAGFADLGFADLRFADLKVGTTYTIGAAAAPGSSRRRLADASSVVVPAASSVVVPTFRSALQQKPGKAEGRNPRLFAPQDLGLLEPPDREAWQKPDQVMDALHVAEGTTVVDLGAGGGWFTMRLARRVGPNGRVYAVDVQRLMIEAISRRIEREGLNNIVKPVLGQFDDPKLPADARPDAVLTVDTFHEMDGPGPDAQERGAHAQAARTDRHHRLSRRRRRPGA